MRQLSPINATGTLSTRRSSWAADARFRAFDLDSQVPASGRPAPAGDRRPRSALRCGADGQAGNVGHGSHRRRRASAAQWSRPARSGCRQTAASAQPPGLGSQRTAKVCKRTTESPPAHSQSRSIRIRSLAGGRDGCTSAGAKQVTPCCRAGSTDCSERGRVTVLHRADRRRMRHTTAPWRIACRRATGKQR
jgi:hypothetical protein